MRFLYCLFSMTGHDGYAVVAKDLLDHLASSGHEVDCAVLVEKRPPCFQEANEPLRKTSRRIFFYDHPRLRGTWSRWLDRAGNRMLPRRTGGRQFCPAGFYRALSSRFDLSRYDAAVAATAKFSRLPDLLSCPTIVDLHEFFTHKEKILRKHGIPPVSPYRNLGEEIEAIQRFDGIWCPSLYCRKILERLIPGKVFLDRHITYRALVPDDGSPAAATAAGSGKILFVGSKAPENVPGLLLFLQDILPPIREAIPSVEFHIVGWDQEDFPRSLDLRNAIPHGIVEDREEVLDLFRAADVVVIPRFLGGLTVKGVEALSLGKPTVGHEAAFSGCYRIESWKHAVVARTSAEFAAAVIRLLRDPSLRAEIGRNAWDFSRERFSPGRAYEDLYRGLEELRSRRRERTGRPAPPLASSRRAGMGP